MARLYPVKLLYLLLLLAVAACSDGAKDTFGLQKAAPDEFRVIAKSPLSIPPNFSLRPPLKNAGNVKDNQEMSAKEALLGWSPPSADIATSPGEDALLANSAVQTANPNIRQILAQDNTPPEKEEKVGFLAKILPSNTEEEILEPDAVVDASAEKERLDRNKKEGKPITEGETPTIVNQPSTLDKLLGNDKKGE